MKKWILLLLFVPIICFGQTREIDKLKAIWIDEMIEFGDIVIQDIDWTATFVPYCLDRELNYTNREKIFSATLTKLGIQTADYYSKKIAKDANNREMVLSSNRIARGRYWIDFSCEGLNLYNGLFCTNWFYNITDSKNNFETVGSIRFAPKVKAYKEYEKAYKKYIKKRNIDKRRAKEVTEVLFEEILKRYSKI